MPDAVNPPLTPYGSAFDIPSFVEMSTQLKGMKLLTLFVARDQRNALKRITAQYRYLGETVDAFYALLGPRHWIFHDALPLDEVAGLLDLSAEEAELALIDLHLTGDWLNHAVKKAGHHIDLRSRRHLLERALDDYRAGRYYSVVLVLISLIDGYVNDVDKSARKGAHSRDPEDMVAWDSVVGHHIGLTSVMPVFQQSFKATSDEPVHELYRHGIVHGNLTNFDNATVATKAWNMLLAVIDWGEARRRSAEPAKETPRLRDTLAKHAETQKHQQALSEWKPYNLSRDDPGWMDEPLVRRATEFLDAWKAGNYGRMAQTLQARSRNRYGKGAPHQMRDTFDLFTLEGYTLEHVEFVAAAIAVVHSQLIVRGESRRSASRWVFEDAEGGVRVSGTEPGEWSRVFDGPEGFLNPLAE